MKYKLLVNDQVHNVDVENDTPLLWVLRDELQLTGSKYGCGIGQCGACSVFIDGKLVRSCITPINTIKNQKITTIEGLAKDDQLTPIQKAWIKHDVPQCGYCQSGQILAATDLLNNNPNPSLEQIKQSMRNICRCGTYVRIQKAVKDAANEVKLEIQS